MSCNICGQPDFIRCNCEAAQPFCDQCAEDTNCTTKMDAQCVIYHFNRTTPSQLTCLGLGNNVSLEEIVEAIDDLVCSNFNIPFEPVDTFSIEWTPGGIAGHKPQADVILSPDAGQIITERANGLFAENDHKVKVDATDTPDFLENQIEGVLSPTGVSIEVDNVGGILQIKATLQTPLTVPINTLLDATGVNDIDNAAFLQQWRWNSLTSGTGLRLSSSSVLAAGDSQTLFGVDVTGVNTTAGQTTYAAKFSNTHSGLTSSNVGIDVDVSGGTDGGTSNIAAILTAPSGGPGLAPILSLRNGSGQKLDFNVHASDSYVIPTGNKLIVTKGFSLFSSVIEKSNMYFGSSAGGTTTTETGVLLEAFTSTVLRGHFNGQSTAVAPATGAYANILIGANHITVGTTTTAPLITNLAVKKQDISLEDGAVVTEYASLYIEGEDEIINAGIGSSITASYAMLVADGRVAIGRPTSLVPTAKLSVNSITQGFLAPRMTTAQRNAIASPDTGLELYNTTLNTKDVYNGTEYFSFGNQMIIPTTIITAGTTGAQTINKPSGQVNFAAGATTLVVTNSLATVTSQVLVTVYGTDTTAISARVTKAAGSFTITLNAAATAETAVGFVVFN